MSPRVEISKRLLLINSASGIGVKILNVSVLVWLNQYLLRRISAEEYALYPVLTGIVLVMPVLATVLTAGLGRYVMAAYARGDDRGVTQIVSTMFPILAAVGVVLLVGGWSLAWYVDRVLDVPADQLWDARVMMALLMLPVALKPVFAPFSIGIYVRQEYVRFNLMNVGNQLFRAFLLFLLLYGVSARVLWVVVANVVAEMTFTVRVARFSMRAIPALRFRSQEIQWQLAWQLMSFGGWNFVGGLAHHLRDFVMPLILNKMATPFDVTVFHIGSLARRQMNLWMNTLAGPLYPVATGMYAIGADERLRNIYTRGGRIAMWGMLLLGLPGVIYSETIIRLYIGAQYATAGLIMALSLGCLPFSAAAFMVWPLSNATGRIRLAATTALGSQLAAIAGAFYAVKTLQWGATGVALATLAVGIATTVAIVWPLGQKLANVTFATYTRKTLLPGLAPGCTAAVVWMLLGIVWRPDSWGGLGLCVLIGSIVYAAVLLGFCLEPQDRQDLARGLESVRDFIWRRRTTGDEGPAHLGMVSDADDPATGSREVPANGGSR